MFLCGEEEGGFGFGGGGFVRVFGGRTEGEVEWMIGGVGRGKREKGVRERGRLVSGEGGVGCMRLLDWIGEIVKFDMGGFWGFEILIER